MTTKSYKEHLLPRLLDPEEAGGYLAAALHDHKDSPETVALCIQDIVEAHQLPISVNSTPPVSQPLCCQQLERDVVEEAVRYVYGGTDERLAAASEALFNHRKSVHPINAAVATLPVGQGARAEELARQCAYEAGRYFDELYLASNEERAKGHGFTSAGVQPQELAPRFQAIISRCVVAPVSQEADSGNEEEGTVAPSVVIPKDNSLSAEELYAEIERLDAVSVETANQNYDLGRRHGKEEESEKGLYSDEIKTLQNDIRFLGASYENGELVIDMKKYNAVHRCAEHRKESWRKQPLDACVLCVLDVLQDLYDYQQRISSPDTQWGLTIYQRAREVLASASKPATVSPKADNSTTVPDYSPASLPETSESIVSKEGELTQYEDQLPEDMPRADYDKWFAASRVVDGVRMGPRYPEGDLISREEALAIAFKYQDETLFNTSATHQARFIERELARLPAAPAVGGVPKWRQEINSRLADLQRVDDSKGVRMIATKYVGGHVAYMWERFSRGLNDWQPLPPPTVASSETEGESK